MTVAPPAVGKLVVVGVGLIGGSFALALKAAGAVGEVVGVGRSRVNLDTALAQGVCDRALTLDDAWTRELATADVVLVATPVGELPALFAAIAPALGAATLVTDAGSTKQDVVAAARTAFGGSALARFVPAHPIAGTEHSGAAAAFATLYRDRNVVLTPVAETDAAATARIAALWARCGARVRLLDAATHDRIFAAVSHLPHLLAFALVDALARRPEAEELFRYAASGFRDFTRIAGSSPAMWRDVALANREALLAELHAYRDALDDVIARVADADGTGLEAMFARASAARRRWDADRSAPGVDAAAARRPPGPDQDRSA
jgi:prephenate dehydrogenase